MNLCAEKKCTIFWCFSCIFVTTTALSNLNNVILLLLLVLFVLFCRVCHSNPMFFVRVFGAYCALLFCMTQCHKPLQSDVQPSSFPCFLCFNATTTVLCNLKQHQKALKCMRTVKCCAFCSEVDCCTQHKKAKEPCHLRCRSIRYQSSVKVSHATPPPPSPVQCRKLHSAQSHSVICVLLTDNVTTLLLLVLFVVFRSDDGGKIGQKKCNY